MQLQNKNSFYSLFCTLCDNATSYNQRTTKVSFKDGKQIQFLIPMQKKIKMLILKINKSFLLKCTSQLATVYIQERMIKIYFWLTKNLLFHFLFHKEMFSRFSICTKRRLMVFEEVHFCIFLIRTQKCISPSL